MRKHRPASRRGIQKRVHRAINSLIALAQNEPDPVRARRYALMARRCGMRSCTRIPTSTKRLFCKKCGNIFFRRGETNVRVRLHAKRSGHITWTCKECGTHRRIPYSSYRINKHKE